MLDYQPLLSAFLISIDNSEEGYKHNYQTGNLQNMKQTQWTYIL